MEKKLTIGILAHVDAGKTTLTDGLLLEAEAIDWMGSVDKGTSISDQMELEKERGISIKTSAVPLIYKGVLLNLIDTPGHVDFSAEVDRALAVLDLVILVVSAREGVQAHTISLWEMLKYSGLQVLVFINKIDRDGCDLEQVFVDFQKDLGAQLFPFNLAKLNHGEAPEVFALSDDLLETDIMQMALENLAELDEGFLESYLEGDLPPISDLLTLAESQVQEGNLTPVLFGSAKLELGVRALLDCVVKLSKSPLPTPEFSAQIFRMEYDPKLGRIAHIRSYGGSLKSKDSIWSQALQQELKVIRIYRHVLGRFEQVKQLNWGEVGGIQCSEILQAGDVLGRADIGSSFQAISEAVLAVQVKERYSQDYQKLGEALEILNIEDPNLDFRWLKDEHEFHLKILGPIQTEVLSDSLEKRFGIEADFLPPTIIYKETPSSSAEGYVRYWMPKPCWAIMTFKIEPGELGSGVTYESKVPTNDISQKYQNEVARAIPWSLQQGIKGWEVTDIKITLMEGSEHNVHSNPGDFLLATPMGVLRGIESAGTDLLEPMYSFEIKANQEFLGAVSSDLNQMQAKIEAPIFDGDTFTLTGRVAVAKAMDYSIQFNASTSGKGRLKLTLDGYDKTETSDEKKRPFSGVNPLDEAQWILHKRGAFKADER